MTFENVYDEILTLRAEMYHEFDSLKIVVRTTWLILFGIWITQGVALFGLWLLLKK
jgi:hypothetical protein